MNWLERWVIDGYLRRQVTQGPTHPERITALYRLIRDAARREFSEDNDITLDSFLKERFEASLETKP